MTSAVLAQPTKRYILLCTTLTTLNADSNIQTTNNIILETDDRAEVFKTFREYYTSGVVGYEPEELAGVNVIDDNATADLYTVWDTQTGTIFRKDEYCYCEQCGEPKGECDCADETED